MSEGDKNEVNVKIIEHESRLGHLEQAVEQINITLSTMNTELRKKSENDVKMSLQVDTMVRDVSEVKCSVKEMNSKLLDTLIKVMDEDKKDRNNDEAEERKYADREKERVASERRAEVEFYRKLILGCLAVGGTIILSAYGISKIVPVFNI